MATRGERGAEAMLATYFPPLPTPCAIDFEPVLETYCESDLDAILAIDALREVSEWIERK